MKIKELLPLKVYPVTLNPKPYFSVGSSSLMCLYPPPVACIVRRYHLQDQEYLDIEV